MDKLIVSRHPGLVAWLTERGITGEVVPHATPAQVRGRIVVGILPLHLAAEAAEVWSVDLPDLPPDWRGRELTPAEMNQAGARITRYRVTRLAEGGECGWWNSTALHRAIMLRP